MYEGKNLGAWKKSAKNQGVQKIKEHRSTKAQTQKCEIQGPKKRKREV
jgi:hypothetical protein